MKSKYYNNIIEYYTSCQADYELVWHLKTHHCMHYGYWDNETKYLRDALHKMNDVIANLGEIKRKDIVADLGCGIGGTANYLADKYNCFVKGISLSAKQINQARDLAKKMKVEQLVTFITGDYCVTEFGENEFDVAYAIESSCYAVEKKVFLQEAFRILKANGKLIVLDFFWTREPKNYFEKTIMKKWTEAWSIIDYENEITFMNKLGEVGFMNIQKLNINDKVLPSIKRLYFYFFPGILFSIILFFLRIRGINQTKNTLSTLYQYILYKRGIWNYNIFYAEKL
ncbi:MAG: methyltransferase domain-containing protein [Ginsengibacter sp.]